MKAWIKYFGLILLLAITGAAVTWIIRVTARSSSQMIALPNGSVVKLARVTFGKEHRYRYDNRWQDVVGSILPRKWRAGLSPRVASFTGSATNSLAVWLRHEGFTNSVPWPPAFFMAVVDDDGLESQLMQSATVTTITRPAVPTTVTGWE